MTIALSAYASDSSWKEGQSYDVTATFLANNSGYDLTTCRFTFPGCNVAGASLTPPFIQRIQNVPTAQAGATAPDGTWVENVYAGSPTVNGWTVRMTLTGKPGTYGPQALKFRITISDTSPSPQADDVLEQTVNVTLTNSSGVVPAPATPTGLAATTNGPNQVNLTWNPVLNASVIYLERATNSGFSVGLVTVSIGGSETGFVNANPGSGVILGSAIMGAPVAATTYYYRIRASNTTGFSAYTSAVSITTPAIPAANAAPTSLNVTAPTHSSVVLNFTPSPVVTAADGYAFTNWYKVFYSTVSGGPWTQFGGFFQTTSNITITGLTANTLYYFTASTVYKESTSIESAKATQASVRTQVLPGTPTTPTNFLATVSDYTHMILTWTLSTGNPSPGYKIGRSTTAGGPFTQIAVIAPGVATYTDTNNGARLASATTYYYEIYAYNNAGFSATATDSETTGTPPATPAAPTNVLATALSPTEIAISFTPPGTTEQFFTIFSAAVTGGPYTQVAEIAASNSYYVDTHLSANTTRFYVVKSKGYSGSSANSSEASATTHRESSTISTQSGFSFHPDSVNEIKQIGGRTIFTSDRDRWVVNIDRKWFKAGLKRQLNAPTVVAAAGGVLDAGTYYIYTGLLRSNGLVRSLPSDPQTIVVTTNKTLRITPDLTGAKVRCRDVGYDAAGNQIDGCDFVEFYVRESNVGTAYLVATVPINDAVWTAPGYYTMDNTLTKANIHDGTRRPLEILFENSLPPAASFIEAKDSHLIAFGEYTFKPTKADIDAGAVVVMTRGTKTFTVSNYTLPEAAIGHELSLNGDPTGWEIYDIESSTAYIRHYDPDIDRQGFRDASGSYRDFSFDGRTSRVSYSAFYEGEALGQITFNPECFPPLTRFESEFFPEDNTDPNGIIPAGNNLLVFKPAKVTLVRGGGELNFPLISVDAISRGSGLNAIRSLARDHNDVVYYLSDSGLNRVSANRVERVTDYTGNSLLFQELFDITSVPFACGVWFNRDDCYVAAGLNRVGNSGFNDGFVYDRKNNAMLPFSLPMRITWLEECKTTTGEYQLLAGDGTGWLLILFKRDISVDRYNPQNGSIEHGAIPVFCYAQSGEVDSEHALRYQFAQSRIKASGNAAAIPFKIEVDGKNRMQEPYTFVADLTIDSDTSSTDDKRTFGGNQLQQSIVRVSYTIPASEAKARVMFKDMAISAVVCGASA